MKERRVLCWIEKRKMVLSVATFLFVFLLTPLNSLQGTIIQDSHGNETGFVTQVSFWLIFWGDCVCISLSTLLCFLFHRGVQSGVLKKGACLCNLICYQTFLWYFGLLAVLTKLSWNWYAMSKYGFFGNVVIGVLLEQWLAVFLFQILDLFTASIRKRGKNGSDFLSAAAMLPGALLLLLVMAVIWRFLIETAADAML